LICSIIGKRLSREGYPCAMTSSRPHRRALPLDEVSDELEKGKVKQLDPKIVEIFSKEKIYDASKAL